jgi:hypothetical protein
MTGSKQRRGTTKRRSGEVRRHSAEHRVRADQITAAARVFTMTWEIVWTLVDELVLRRTGPGRLL